MATLLFIIFAAVFFWIIIKAPFFKKAKFPIGLIIFLFLARACSGVLNCYLSYHYFPNSDALTFHNIALNEYYLLLHQPQYFFNDLFKDTYYHHYSGFFDTYQSFWNNLRMNLIVKSLAVLDIITLRNLYTNTLIYNFAVFTGSVAMYRAVGPYIIRFRWLLIVAIFLLPSVLYFTSPIQKDGLILMCTGFIFYYLVKILNIRFTMIRLLATIFFFALILFLRNFVAIILLPAIFAWIISHYNPKRKWVIFSSVLFVCVVLFFNLKSISPSADFPKNVSDRRVAFDTISSVSNTYLPLGKLSPDLPGFAIEAPQAFFHAFFLPLPFTSWKSILFSIELYVVWIFFLFTLFRKRKDTTIHPLFLSILFFALINLIMIGYTIPNLGALIRYRSIYLELIFVSIIAVSATGFNNNTEDFRAP